MAFVINNTKAPTIFQLVPPLRHSFNGGKIEGNRQGQTETDRDTDEQPKEIEKNSQTDMEL